MKTQLAQAQAELQEHAEYAVEEVAAARAEVEAQATDHEMKARLHAVQNAKALAIAVQLMERKAAEAQAAWEDKRTNRQLRQAQLGQYEEEEYEWTPLVKLKRAAGVR